MIKQISFSFNFGDIFVSTLLNILDIEVKEDLDIDKSEDFNINI